MDLDLDFESQLKVVDVVRAGSELRIRLDGRFGHGEENLRSGRLVERTLLRALEEGTDGLTEVVIDYFDVHGVGGDGPIWSAMPARRRKLDVRLVASGRTFEYLSELLAVTNMDRLIRLDKS